MPHILVTLGLVFLSIQLTAQSYTSYRTGNASSIDTTGTLSLTLMGGATEQDSAMVWFLEQANGGDVLVIRASGSDGYNDYLYSELGVQVNSVETIAWHSKEASADPYVLSRIAEAEAIWIAGGDQAVYVDYWRDTEVNIIISDHLAVGTLAIGGTSAGAAILGNYYFTAENGTITSEEALNNPLDDRMTLDTMPFFDVPLGGPFSEMKFITDSHFDDPDRSGRLAAFIYVLSTQVDEVIYGIGIDEYTAMTITAEGEMVVYGEYPQEEDHVQIIGPWCINYNIHHGIGLSSDPLTLSRRSLSSLRLNGLASGTEFLVQEFSLTEDISDFEFDEFLVMEGVLLVTPIMQIVPYCLSSTDDLDITGGFHIYPNPVVDKVRIDIPEGAHIDRLALIDANGKHLSIHQTSDHTIDLSYLNHGMYRLLINDRWTLDFIKG